ncbi:anti-sigma factor antagonist [Staphylococcus haemolyticus]|uniref:anti-sigma factor antagonist n=1 Tax=Staphylococcus haemolyticus TaxID=1283 RepID=UPI0021A8B236|nr:anti-sigma factor antagonist [Staphylococcus haemolyticus]MCT1757539.1 anti-sigma factor antagonist [Staphylococcus haemolyticus]
MNLNIETVTHDEYYEVIVAGELDVYTVSELEEVLMPMRQEGTHDIHVNVTNVSYMDSTGLGLFVGTLKALNQNDKELYILGVSDRIGRLFDITGLKDLMHVNEGTEVE